VPGGGERQQVTRRAPVHIRVIEVTAGHLARRPTSQVDHPDLAAPVNVEAQVIQPVPESGDPAGRLGVRGYWLVPLTGLLDLELDASWFRVFGLDLELDGAFLGLEEEGEAEDPSALAVAERVRFARTTLAYGLARPLGPLRLESVFVGYARGLRPTGPEGRRAWTVGAEIELPR
jgi:hypothetical protein